MTRLQRKNRPTGLLCKVPERLSLSTNSYHGYLSSLSLLTRMYCTESQQQQSYERNLHFKFEKSRIHKLTMQVYTLILFQVTITCWSLSTCVAEHNHCSVATIFGLKTADCRNMNLKTVSRSMAADLKVTLNNYQLTGVTYLIICDANNAYVLVK
jgi:hypothetical protein